MNRIRQRFIPFAAALFGLVVAAATAQEPSPSVEVLISIADQKMAVLRDGGLVQRFPVSTSRFGAGDANRSYKTPLGQLRVCEKVGDDLMPGAVIKHRSATGEVLDVNAPGRDPIVTRIIWLDGLEEQNRNAKERGIYIHGTPEEKRIGQPVSWGCIRMRSKDVVELYDELPVGASVRIIAERLPHLRKYKPPKPMIIAARTLAPASPAASRIAAVKTTLPKPAPLPARQPAPIFAQAPAPLPKPLSPLGKPVAPMAKPVVPYVSSGLLAPKPAPVIAAGASPKRSSKPLPEIGEGSRKTIHVSSPSRGAEAFTPMKGSILFAGLPDGSAPQPSATPEPKKLPHASPLTIAAPAGGLTLFPSPSPEEPPGDTVSPPSDASSHLAARNSPLPTPGATRSADRQ